MVAISELKIVAKIFPDLCYYVTEDFFPVALLQGLGHDGAEEPATEVPQPGEEPVRQV